jgi:hypothetical protein
VRAPELGRVGEALAVGDVDAAVMNSSYSASSQATLPWTSQVRAQLSLVLDLDALDRALAGVGEVTEEGRRIAVDDEVNTDSWMSL